MPNKTDDNGARAGENVSQVHDRLREEILTGRIAAGATSQVALARQLDVGRTPLREALRLLQREGLVIFEPNRRVRIAELSPEDAEELYVMRVALEAVAIQITVADLGTTGVAELEGLFAQMDHYTRSRDFTGMRVPHRAFHARLVSGVGERVSAEIGLLFDHAERYRTAFGGSSDDDWSQRRAQHQAILAAAGDGDGPRAAAALMEHYAHTAQLVFKGLDPDYEPDHLRRAIETVAPGASGLLEA